MSRRRGSSRGWLWLLVGFALALACVAGNPSPERHQTAIRESFEKENRVLGKLGVGNLYALGFRYQSYLVCSVTRDQGELKSFGTLGMVFTF